MPLSRWRMAASPARSHETWSHAATNMVSGVKTVVTPRATPVEPPTWQPAAGSARPGSWGYVQTLAASGTRDILAAPEEVCGESNRHSWLGALESWGPSLSISQKIV